MFEAAILGAGAGSAGILRGQGLVRFGEESADEFAAGGDADLSKIALMWSRTVWGERKSSSAILVVARPRVSIALMSARLEPAQRGGAMGLLNLIFFFVGGIGSATAGTLSESVDLTSALAMVAVLPLLAGALALLLPPARPVPGVVILRGS